jgi:sugar lactone lactonase YvrE
MTLRNALASMIVVLGVSFIMFPPPAHSEPFDVIAEYPAGNFLENLDVLPDGKVVFTSYFAKTIEVIAPGQTLRTFSRLTVHPVSILSIENGFLVAAHGQPFTNGPSFVETQQFVLLDVAGKEVASFKAPEARFLNGMVRHDGGSILIADSIAATIWKINPTSRTIEPWLSNDALSQDPAVKEFRPGANGLKRQGGRLVFSNSSRGTLSSVAIDGVGATGAIEPIATVGPIDDFLIDTDGSIIFTTHGDALRRLAMDGSLTTLIASGCDGCTAVARLGDALLVLTTGGFAEGRKEPARVLRLPYAAPR